MAPSIQSVSAKMIIFEIIRLVADGAFLELLARSTVSCRVHAVVLILTEPDWKTIVLDFAFERPAPATYDGFHFTLRSPGDSEQLNEYQQYAQFSGQASFTERLTPDTAYDGGTAGPLPGNATLFKLDAYPMGYGYHAVCDPTGANGCFLGVGAGANMEFEVIVTVFYVAPAPAGFTRLP